MFVSYFVFRIFMFCRLSVRLLAQVLPAATARTDIYPPDMQLRSNSLGDSSWSSRPSWWRDGRRDRKGRASVADGHFGSMENHTLPNANGPTTLQAGYDGQTGPDPLVVQEVAALRPISFRMDVMPVFMWAGFNTGSCHSSAHGKDGFRLSLFTFDLKSLLSPQPRIGLPPRGPRRARGQPGFAEGHGRGPHRAANSSSRRAGLPRRWYLATAGAV